MQIDINEAELQQTFTEIITKRMNQRISDVMNAWDWKGLVARAVQSIVESKLAELDITPSLLDIDKEMLMQMVKDALVEELLENR